MNGPARGKKMGQNRHYRNVFSRLTQPEPLRITYFATESS